MGAAQLIDRRCQTGNLDADLVDPGGTGAVNRVADDHPRRLARWVQAELGPHRLLPGLTAGALIGIGEVIVALSLGSLIFAGDLAPFLPYGIGMALLSAPLLMAVMALISRVPGVIATTQDSPAVILAIAAAGVAGTMAGARVEDRLATVLVVIAAATLLSGVAFLALGFFRLGGLVRFIPYPVVGGFLAGTGWLLVQGSFDVMAGLPLAARNLAALFQPAQVILWAPGVVLALALFFGLRRIRHFLAMPAILVGAIVLFYVALWATGTSIGEATRRGLLLGSAAGQVAWQPLTDSLLAASWPAILGQAGNLAIVLLLSLVGLLLNASGLELAIHRDVDLNHELRAAGIANLLSGLSGGLVGYHALSLSALTYRMGARGRLPGLVAAAICLAMLVAGSALLGFLPRPILGGLLLFMGLDFVFDWVIAGWRRLARADYAVVLLILVSIGVVNLLAGVGIGLLAAVILFVLNYSRTEFVHHALSGTDRTSNVERCAYHRRVLADLSRHVYILELQGFIFFGTGNALLERIRARLADATQPPVRYIVLDFRRVTGLDSSAVLSFAKGEQLAADRGIALVLTHVSDRLRQQFQIGGLVDNGRAVRFFCDLDHGLEWCEEELLRVKGVTTLHVPLTLGAQLADSGFKNPDTVGLMRFLERIDFQAGDCLLRQGDESDRLYFIERGTVCVYLDTPGGERLRLRTLGLGTAVGEMGLYLGGKCSAWAIAEGPGTAYRLTRSTLADMKEREPELAATFHEFIAHLLSERMATTTRTLSTVLD